MDISIIGTGNIGSALAVALQKKEHAITFGVRDKTASFKGKETAARFNIPYENIPVAVSSTDVIILAVPAQSVIEAAQALGDVSGKIIIDTANAVSARPGGFTNTADAILNNCNATHVVKCFNTTGYENIANPVYNGSAIDMFVAGNSENGKNIATQLALDIGFAHCYDFGGNDRFFLLEQFAFAWINLAMMQKNGRDIALKLLKR